MKGHVNTKNGEISIENQIKCGNLTSNLLKLKLTEQLRKCTFVLLA